MWSIRLKTACFSGPPAGKSNPRKQMIPILRSITGVGTCATLALLAGCASTDSFARLDANRDGAGSRAEFDTFMKQEVFNRVDANSDGRITLSEWQAFNPKVDQARFRKTDTNRDGFISRAEADAAFDREGSLDKLFDKIDTDGNGSLSRAEARAFRAQVRKHSGAAPAVKTSNPTQP
jgi:hypothetical protein